MAQGMKCWNELQQQKDFFFYKIDQYQVVDIILQGMISKANTLVYKIMGFIKNIYVTLIIYTYTKK